MPDLFKDTVNCWKKMFEGERYISNFLLEQMCHYVPYSKYLQLQSQIEEMRNRQYYENGKEKSSRG